MKLHSIQPNCSNGLKVRKNLNQDQTQGMPQPEASAQSPSFCAAAPTRRGFMAAIAGLAATPLLARPALADRMENFLAAKSITAKAVPKCSPKIMADSVEIFKNDLLYSIDIDVHDLALSYARIITRKGPDANIEELTDRYLLQLRKTAINAANRANTIPLGQSAFCGKELTNLHSEGNIEFEFNKFRDSGEQEIEKAKLVRGLKAILAGDEEPKYLQGRLKTYLEEKGCHIASTPVLRAFEELNRSAYGNPAGRRFKKTY